MIKMDRTPYGLHIVMAGTLTPEEVTKWGQDIITIMNPPIFNLLVLLDISTIRPLNVDVKQPFMVAFETFLDFNMVRLSVVYQSFALYLQMKNLLIKVGVSNYRFFNTKMPAFGRISREWMVNGTLDENG